MLFVLAVYKGAQADLTLTDGKYFVQVKEEYTWDQAKAFCTDNKMKLVSIVSQAKEEEVVALVVKAKKALPEEACASKNEKLCEYRKTCDVGYIWTSGYEVETQKEPRQFQWTATNTPVSYVNWGLTQPNNWAGDEQRCLEIDVSYHFGVADWNDERCTGKNGFVCEI